ncbi:MAG TPA: iron-containing alcohol dehydrogenase, partial [Anaerolineales bacterium]|nr:iron-containing alcohol dehydrogenase [Anaerolineales bacterium]
MRIPSLPPLELIPLDELAEPNPILLVTTPDAWEFAAADLRTLNIALRLEPQEATMPHWMTLAADLLGKLRNTEYAISAIYAVGNGLITDTAKYLAFQTKLPLTCIPTALADDSFLTSTSAARHAGCVEYVDTQAPNRVIVDLDLIATAPKGLRAAGICEVLSSYTALWDWEMAEEQDKNPPEMALAPWAADAAEAILQGALDCAPAAGEGDPDGLKQLLDCLAMSVQLCNQLGHTRPKEGSEHYFAYAVENHVPSHSHAERLALGLLLMAKKQDQDLDEVQAALEACHIPLNVIPKEIVKKTLRELPEYVQRHDLPYGIAHELG